IYTVLIYFPPDNYFSACHFFFQAEDGIRDFHVTGVQTCALPISSRSGVSQSVVSGTADLLAPCPRRCGAGQGHHRAATARARADEERDGGAPPASRPVGLRRAPPPP